MMNLKFSNRERFLLCTESESTCYKRGKFLYEHYKQNISSVNLGDSLKTSFCFCNKGEATSHLWISNNSPIKYDIIDFYTQLGGKATVNNTDMFSLNCKLITFSSIQQSRFSIRLKSAAPFLSINSNAKWTSSLLVTLWAKKMEAVALKPKIYRDTEIWSMVLLVIGDLIYLLHCIVW